ncbi:MAG: helix-turn-helix transcriptional regulator [Lachnospiraceae bacterium]|nr:helix-turn-helix transcriptional regulator [Lachnospiraceae bacterium]
MSIFKTSDSSGETEEKKEEEQKRVDRIFTDRLETVLIERDIVKKDFAQSIGIAPNTLSGYLNGSHMPDLVTFDMICRQLGVSADYMLGRTDNPNVDKGHSGNENELLSFYRLISEKYQYQVIGEVKGIAKLENRLKRK